MSSRDNRIYRNRRPVKITVTTVLVLLALLILLSVSVFFGFRKYIVYTDNGIRLDIPWLQETSESSDGQ